MHTSEESEETTKALTNLLNLSRIYHLRGQKISLDNQISSLYNTYQNNKSNPHLNVYLIKEITFLMDKFFLITQELISLEQSLNKKQTKPTCT